MATCYHDAMNQQVAAEIGRGRLIVDEDRLRPVRGLVPLQNRRGAYYPRNDVFRWLRLNREAYNALKVDLLVRGSVPEEALLRYLDQAKEIDFRLSVRVDAVAPPPDLGQLATHGLFDVFIVSQPDVSRYVTQWLDACREAGLPVRLQLQPPLPQGDPKQLAKEWARAGVVVVNVAAYDPLSVETLRTHGEETLNGMMRLAGAVEDQGVEANLLRIPFCHVRPAHWTRLLNAGQFFADHNQYERRSYQLAQSLSDKSPEIAGKIVLMLLGKYTLFDNPIDNKLLPWIVESPWLRARVVAWHKVTRHLRIPPSLPMAEKDQQGADTGAETAAEPHHSQCAECSVRLVCDQMPPAYQARFPALSPRTQEGDAVAYPLHFAKKQSKFYDEIDEGRRKSSTVLTELAGEARQIVANRPADREIDSYEYTVERQWAHQLPGGLRWYGFSNTEKLSSPLARLSPPFTLSAVFGGGIAEFIGFGVGRHGRILCPMEAYRHELVLHVDANGRYVLLRDGRPMRPAAFEGRYGAPVRLGSVVEPRIAIWNIDNTIVTQNVMLWEGGAAEAAPGTAKFSIIMVCVRYARRMQAALQSALHQEGFDTSDLEIIVAHVPGVDGAEDVLDNLAETYPGVRFVRSTFPEREASAKGYLINESLKLATGEWVVLLDADTLVPPDFFARLTEAGAGAHFMVPDGRKLLSKATTAKILLGELKPWERWPELLKESGEFRYREMEGVPIGFCQCVRRDCFETVTYYEVDHFEGADWQFSIDMRAAFGPEKRLSGTPVLHLDHGGSKWYGTTRHF